MNCIKRFVFQNVIPVLGRLSIRNNRFCNVIYYHDIVEGSGETYMKTSIDVFRRQMDYIAEKGYKTIRFDELGQDDNLTFAKKKVIIAFDDGWRSNYEAIFDYMKSRGIKYNVFLTIGKIGNDEDYLTWDQVRSMHDSGLVGFGTHTFTHANLSDFSTIDYDLEIVKANEIFERELGYKSLDFCYPFGFYSEDGNHILEKNRVYQRIYTSRMMYSYFEDGSIIMGRNGINNDWPMKVYRNQLDGYYNVFGKLF